MRAWPAACPGRSPTGSAAISASAAAATPFDSTHSSSLLAVASACSALAAGDIDAAVAGGVDLSFDPFELAGLANTGALAGSEMRIFDARPTGFWPGEGCGLIVVMRARDARAAGIPAYAEIVGWGVSSAGNPALTKPGSGSLLLALRRAYQRAGIDPAAAQLIEGDGTGTGSGDLAELTSLAEIRQGASGLAALGSVKGNIGHAKAAAGAAGLIKATLAVAAGVIPPTTGCVRPHPLITSEDARLRVLRTAEPWPEGTRLAGVSAVGPGGTSVHVVVRRDVHGGRRRRAPWTAQLTAAAGTGHRRGGAPRPGLVVSGPPRTEAYVFSGPDRHALTRELTRIGDLAPWLSDGELHDLACQAGRASGPGSMRVALVASTQDQLAGLAREAVALLPGLRPGSLTLAPGIYAADGGRGRVALLFPGEGAPLGAAPSRAASGEAGTYDPVLQPGILAASLAGLRWLDQLGVVATTAVGHGLGEITALVWAGCLSEPDAARLVSQRGALLAAPSAERTALVCVDADARTAAALCAGSDLVIAADNGPRCQVLAGPVAAVRDLTRRLAADAIPARVLDAPHGFYSPVLADRVASLRSVLSEFSFRAPARRLLSTVTGAELASGDDIAALLAAQLTAPVRFAGPLGLAASDADLLVETGPGHGLSLLAADCCDVPAVSLGSGRADVAATAEVMAALFAVGAVRSLAAPFSGRAARTIDIWRERVFIASPCGSAPPPGIRAWETEARGTAGDPAAVPPPGRPGRRRPGSAGRTGQASQAEPAQAEPAQATIATQAAQATEATQPAQATPTARHEAPALTDAGQAAAPPVRPQAEPEPGPALAAHSPRHAQPAAAGSPPDHPPAGAATAAATASPPTVAPPARPCSQPTGRGAPDAAGTCARGHTDAPHAQTPPRLPAPPRLPMAAMPSAGLAPAAPTPPAPPRQPPPRQPRAGWAQDGPAQPRQPRLRRARAG